ncbi:MAG TPA: type II secretion system F family protein [Candidatus Eisenbacteria bacterium]|nr:type II secretion system F family protein [Candidatus Eisenbacteria bacterium]
MPIYLYAARDAEGRVVEGKQEAASEYLAVRILQSRGLLITRIVDSAAELKVDKKKGRKRHQRVKSEDLLFFVRQSAILLDAGVPLLKAVTMLTTQIESEKLFRALDRVKDEMRAGSSLKAALAKDPKVFPPMWTFLIEAGETSGNLPLVLNQLADHLEASINLKKKVASALVYPAVLVVLTFAAVLVFLLKIIPVFAKLFANFNAKLPPLTLAVIAVSDFARAYFFYVVVAAVAGVYFLRRYSRTPGGRRVLDRFIIRIPVFGELMRDSILARIAINLSTLVKSGVNLLKSIEITARASGNAIYETALENIEQEIQQGKTLSAALGDSALFPPILISMIAIGEESGRLAEMLERVAKYHESRVDVFLGRLSTLIEPLVLVLVGGFVGLLVVSMFLPIFSLSNVIK